MKNLYFRKYCLIIISIIVMSIQVHPQSSGWTKKADITKGGGAACVVNDTIYVVGGSTSNYLTDVDYNMVYDQAINNWEEKEPMPTARGFLFAAAVNGTVYAIGGGFPTPKLKVEAYDRITDTWTTKRDIPEGRIGCNSSCVIDGVIYIVGGNYNEGECWAYYPDADTFIQKSSMPQDGGGGLSVTAYNGFIYTFGGSTYSPWAARNTVYAYNPQTDIWTQKDSMPTARFAFQTYLVNGKIYAIGGSSYESNSLSTVEVYDPVADSWETLPDMPRSIAWFSGAVVNNKIYVIGGSQDWSIMSHEVWEYDPSTVGVEKEYLTSDEFALFQNYPNPFNPGTQIKFSVPSQSEVIIKVYDILGKEIEILVSEEKPAGTYEVTWNAEQLPSGVYFYQLKAGDFIQTKKMILLK